MHGLHHVRLLQARAAAPRQAVHGHARSLQGGTVFKTVGDAFCAAFATPPAALSATLAAQQQLVSESWPTGRPIRVRAALHTGVCEERDNDYFGPAVNRTARLQAIAHGGQVVLSGTTADPLSGLLPGSVR